jgi:hypothetical protein
MKLPFGRSGGKDPAKFDDSDRLVNAPVELWVGGRQNSKPKKITLREPSLLGLGKHISLISGGLIQAVQKNAGLFDRIAKKAKLSKDETFDFGDVPEATVLLLCDIVGEDEEYVMNEMTARQATAVISTYLDLVGWDYIVETFTQAWQKWQAAFEKATGMPSAPPWSARRPSKSAMN